MFIIVIVIINIEYSAPLNEAMIGYSYLWNLLYRILKEVNAESQRFQ